MYKGYGTYASVKKPIPATTQTLAWNQLGEIKLNLIIQSLRQNLREFGIVDLG